MSKVLKEAILFLKEKEGSTLDKLLRFDFIELSGRRTVGKVIVEEGKLQPFGLMHGGLSLVLIESLASVGAWLRLIEDGDYQTLHEVPGVVGLEINASHLRGVKYGEEILGVSEPVRVGRRHQVWEGKVYKGEELVSVGRVTLVVK